MFHNKFILIYSSNSSQPDLVPGGAAIHQHGLLYASDVPPRHTNAYNDAGAHLHTSAANAHAADSAAGIVETDPMQGVELGLNGSIILYFNQPMDRLLLSRR